MKIITSMYNTIGTGIIVGVCAGFAVPCVSAAEALAADTSQGLTIETFIEQATAHDTVFERILIDELRLQYEKDLQLPARDLVLEVKEQCDLILNQDREEEETTLSLKKLFPHTGTTLAGSYSTRPSYTATQNSSEMTLSLTQPIARNAFGRATRLHDKIIGLEVDVARHQITEAYEDYFAAVLSAYYEWYAAYQNMRVGESSYAENVKLLQNMEERKESKIALPIDVNKTHLQVLAKKESLVALRETYEKATTVITTAIRAQTGAIVMPREPRLYETMDISFDNDFKQLTAAGRTFQILSLLEEKSTLDVAKDADDLLPSIDLELGYSIEGGDYAFKGGENMLYGAVSIEYPFFGQVDRVEHQIAKIEEKKRKLLSDNVYYSLYTTLKNIALAIEREKALIKIADEKIALAQAVLEDETKNYTYGKVSLNDYIDAVNKVDTNRFSKIDHTLQLNKLIIEWLRLTDRLIDKQNIALQE